MTVIFSNPGVYLSSHFNKWKQHQHSMPMPLKPTINCTDVINQINHLRIQIMFLYAADAINNYSIEITVPSSSFSYNLYLSHKMLQSEYVHHFYYKACG
jgi:hypothetical protein